MSQVIIKIFFNDEEIMKNAVKGDKREKKFERSPFF